MKTALPTLLLLLLTSCSTTGKDGTKHYYVLGFGVVSVNNTNPTSASVCRMQTVGLGISSVPWLWAGLGYADATTVMVPTTNSVLMEVK